MYRSIYTLKVDDTKKLFFCLGQVKASRLASDAYKEFGRFGFW